MTILNKISGNSIQNQGLSHSNLRKQIIREFFTDLRQKFSSPDSSTSSRRTLRTQLLITVLPTVIVPLAIASAIAINFTQRQAKERLKIDTIQTLRLAAEATRQSMEGIFGVTDVLEINRDLVNALKVAGEETSSNKVPSKHPIVNQYLQLLGDKKKLDNIVVVERNGNAIAYSDKSVDIVQDTLPWWDSVTLDNRRVIEPAYFDEASGTAFVTLIRTIKDPISTSFLGITKISKSIEFLNEEIFDSLKVKISDAQQVQVISVSSGEALSTFKVDEAKALGDVLGGKPLIEAMQIFQSAITDNPEEPQQVIDKINNKNGITNANISNTVTDELVLSFELQNRIFNILNVPESDLAVVASVTKSEIAQAGQELAITLTLIAVALAVIAIGVVVLLARQLSQPLTNLTKKAQQVAEGNLDVKVELQGTQETYTLGDSFNNLVKQVNNLIDEQKTVAQEREKQKEALQTAIYQLLEEVEGALDGDLTVKASLDSMEISTVADLVNAIIDNLREIAIQVKQSTSQVSTSLGENEKSIEQLTLQAIKEAEATNNTLKSVKVMSKSIEMVAENARQASTFADSAFQETQAGTQVMDDTVNSIISLRSTVGETAKKIKRLGESSQKISQVVSLIEEIALKTNLLAINASVEAGRAGEQGQGFTIVAEQVGALAEQSATATKEIAKIITSIQVETQEVTQAMELGTAQVVDSTRLVEATKKRLETVLERSQRINDLMRSISEATVTQTDTSALVTELMQEIAQYSETRLKSSQEVAESMRNTAQVAQQLQSAVEQFKVE
ncbi:methyl-accepting chemotaxis protein [Geminocystis sp. GBBB08]|uniref:methyl-accepting chemotaxis protein n=1 Tax=Geminocystis sp. GBBB08 TaxID=2604140 RepID=UPI0027E383E8|nr:methyl-accepting chemotaxis protein [Geminocystis sp. GBBB08]MBL1210580.1 HAMP domain-containing protein [Geminocystis sp. GBBB08]